MKTLSRILPLLFIGWALQGCSTTSSGHGVDDEFSFAKNPNEGLFAFSLRWDRKCEKSNFLLPVTAQLFIEGGKHFEQVVVENPFLGEDFENPPGFLYVRSSTPGKRKIDEVTLTMDHRKYNIPFKPVKFNIFKGKMNYLGELYIKAENCRDKIIRNMAFPSADSTIKITNQWKRDRKMIAERLKNYKSIPKVIQLMKQ